ncbi:MAG TPA: cupredoxin domain-containing protein [Roseiflexaceae bacterium]|nr:cupredoxin domain-containing protein [Roseiflexaceae bacterium]
MGTPLVATRTWSLKPLGALRLWTIVGLVGSISALIYIQVTSIGFDPLVSGFVLLALSIATGVIVGWRWAPLLGALWSILLLAAFGPFMIYDLTHPAVFDHFALAVPVVAFLVATVVAGIGATVQHERSRRRPDPTTEPRQAPRWLLAFLGALTGLCLGALVVASLEAGTSGGGVSAEALAKLPALATLPNTFDHTELRAKVGETVALRLENQDTQSHSFDIDEFTVHTLLPAGATNLALFTASTAGTYAFYCSIPGHREAGMVGTLIVER